MFAGARILVAPLDWGLGHSTRDIPIIQRLLELDARPIIGADKGPLALLHDRFPDVPFVRVPGVEIRYAKGASQGWAMAKQFPAMLRSVREEHHVFLALRPRLALNAVISDQRFGLRAPGLPSVLITHQVFPFTPFAQGMLRRINLRSIARFDRCWIPDEPTSPGLAGELSHGRHLPPNACYIGPLSRLNAATALPPAKRYTVVCVISGPEPQRTLFEQRLMEQLPRIPGEHLLVLGRPEPARDETIGHVRVVGHLGGDALAGALLQAKLIISRTGYTTVMDLAALGRTALLVPTPGQEEQEYLGRLHAASGRFIIGTQDGLDIAAALARMHDAPSAQPRPMNTNAALEQALQQLARTIHERRHPPTTGSPTFAQR